VELSLPFEPSGVYDDDKLKQELCEKIATQLVVGLVEIVKLVAGQLPDQLHYNETFTLM